MKEKEKKPAKELEEYLVVSRDVSSSYNKGKMRYSSIYDFILKEGKPFPLGKATPKSIGKMGQCYYNAYQLVLENPSYTYCEGFAYSSVIPLAHAWVVDRHGKVIDPTWPDGEAYFGVHFQFSYVMRIMFSKKAVGPLIDNWEQGFPLLTGKHIYKNGIVDILESEVRNGS